jgi:acyl-CoA synthetase (AMP-forming)/AMP-acid ligase II
LELVKPDQDSLRHDPYITDIKLNTDKLELRSFASYSRVPFEGMNLAYIVFTSGSTGEPKGIQMSHKATISFFKGLKSFETNAEEIIGSTAPLQFDLSLIDLGTALPVGCSLVQIPNILVHYPPKFVEFCNNNRVSQIHGVPSIWYEFLNHYPQLLKEFKYLKRVVFGGEDFPYNHLRLMEENLPSIDFIQAFGQSESIACAYKIMRSPLPFWQNKLPVGKGFDNNILLLVSEEGEIVREQGVPGELYISGDFLFSGYLKNVRKTEEVLFETERFTGLKQKYFKTGDLLVIGPDDEYFFIRRKDSQVKYLGNRIELEEIEGVLNSDKNVSLATVVLAPEPHPGLVAFVILKDDSGIEEKENRLRDSCASKLPPYMIPSRFIFVDRLNVTANGKIDKKSLILELQ